MKVSTRDDHLQTVDCRPIEHYRVLSLKASEKILSITSPNLKDDVDEEDAAAADAFGSAGRLDRCLEMSRMCRLAIWSVRLLPELKECDLVCCQDGGCFFR